MNFYVRFPTEENMSEFENRCAEFKSYLIIEKIKRLNISEFDKQQTLQYMITHLKENPL